MTEEKRTKSVILRLPENKYHKLKQVAAVRSVVERKYVSMQKVMEEQIDAIPDPSPQSSEMEKEEAV